MRHQHCLPCALDAHDSDADTADTRAAISDREVDRLATAMLALTDGPRVSEVPRSMWEVLASLAP